MLKRILHIAFSLWLAILLFFGNTPQEYIHIFAGHTDTVHTHHGDELCIEPQHHHCEFLSFTLAEYINNFDVPKPRFTKTTFPGTAVIISYELVSQPICTSHLRGPPASA